MHKVILSVTSILWALACAVPAAAEFELNLYVGSQSAPHSRVSGTHPDGGSYSGLIGWQGKSTAPPPYYGLRGTWWRTDRSGFALEFTHAKVYAPAAERGAINFSRMELTDGHNIITLNYMMRWPDTWGPVTPYAGAGLGIALPHVDITSAGGARTYGYQLTGPAARLIAGASYDISERWSVFGEYQFTVSNNKADLTGGGTFNSRIITNAVNVGVGFKF